MTIQNYTVLTDNNFHSSQELESLLQNEFMKADPSELSQTNLRLIEASMRLRNSLLVRLSMIGKEEIKVCDARVDQKSKLETFRGLLEDLLLKLVSNGSSQISQLRYIHRFVIFTPAKD